MPVQYKFVELSIVTEQTIEECVNEWVAQGWHFDDIRFVKVESSRRPAMAFVSFVREGSSEEPPRELKKPEVDRVDDETTFELDE